MGGGPSSRSTAISSTSPGALTETFLTENVKDVVDGFSHLLHSSLAIM